MIEQYDDDYGYDQGATYGDSGFDDWLTPEEIAERDHEAHEEYLEEVWPDGYDKEQDYTNFLIDAGLLPEGSTVEDMLASDFSL